MPDARDQAMLSFLAEWFDPLPQLTKQYLLKYFVSTNEAEMVELKTRRLFLKRSPCPPHFSPQEFALGSKVILYGRDLVIAAYGDKSTEIALTPETETAAFLIGPEAFSSDAGKVLDAIISETRGVLDRLKTVRLDDAQAKEVTRHLGQVADESAHRLSDGGIALFGVIRGGNAGDLAAKACANLASQLGWGDAAEGGVFCAASGKPTEELSRLFARGGPITRGKGKSTAIFDDCTCCVIKPHAMKTGHVGKIVDRILSEGFSVSALETFTLNRKQAHEFLEVYQGVIPNFSEVLDEMVTGSCVALEVRGKENPVQAFRDIAGPWDVDVAKELRPKSIRAMFGEKGARTGVHCTDLPDDGPSESRYFFELMQ